MSTMTARQLAAARVQHALDYIDRFAGRHYHDDKPARDALVIALLKQRAGSSIFRIAELEAAIGDAAPATPDALQAEVTLTERITGGSISLVVDYLVSEDEVDAVSPLDVRAVHIEVIAAWAGTQNVQHWLDDAVHTEIRRQIAAQLRASAAQAVAEGAALQQAEAEVL